MNNANDIKDGVIKALEETFIFISPDEFDSVDLTNYIDDSMQFMTFIVNLEDVFSIELPPDLLLFENFIHTKDICAIVSELKKEDF